MHSHTPRTPRNLLQSFLNLDTNRAAVLQLVTNKKKNASDRQNGEIGGNEKSSASFSLPSSVYLFFFFFLVSDFDSFFFSV